MKKKMEKKEKRKHFPKGNELNLPTPQTNLLSLSLTRQSFDSQISKKKKKERERTFY